MATDDVVANEVQALRGEVEDISRTLSAMARTGTYQLEIEKAFRKDTVLAEVFLAVSSASTQSAIVGALLARGLTVHQTTVSAKLRSLDEDWDLIKAAGRDKSGNQYVQTRLAKDLKIVRIAQVILKLKKS